MQRTVGIYILSVLVVLPWVWLLSTANLGSGARSMVTVGGGLLMTAFLVGYAWRSHFRGKLLPNLCKTCGHGMVRFRPGEVKPPKGFDAAEVPKWRCPHCGRLA